jgi:20S proteasome alpha/beta subunit
MFFRILAAFASVSVAASATTIVALRSPEGLLLAADSNVITNVPNVLGTACKISEDGSISYAFSGFVADRNAGYDADGAGRNAAPAGGVFVVPAAKVPHGSPMAAVMRY